jgi:hypothetical protein
MRVQAAQKRGDRHSVVSHLGSAWISVCFLGFYGLDLYGQSLTHAPADMLVFAAFGWLSLRKPYGGASAAALFGGLGALAFAFDFLHGTIPLILAVLIGCGAIAAYQSRVRLRMVDLVSTVGAFCVGVAGAALTKLATVLLLQGSGGISSFFGALAYRMAGDSYSHFDVVYSLARRADMIFWGQRYVGIAVLTLCLAALGMAVLRALRRKLGRNETQLIILLSASMAVILLWYIIFKNHSAIHGFMVRLLVWLVAVGPLGLALSLWAARPDKGSLEGRPRSAGPAFEI